MDHDLDIKRSSGFAPGFLKRGLFWTIARWGTLGAMAGVIAVAWRMRGIVGIEVPDPLMYTNLGNLAFWILWIMGIVVLVPLVGRAWCGVCPIGFVNEITARFGLKRPFPRFIRNQNPKALALVITVVLMGVYRMHHYPDATAWYLLAWIAAAVGAGVLFAGRSLCAYLCPVGGMLGLYGRIAPLTFGVRDEVVCRDCRDRECVRGAANWTTAGWGRFKISLRMRKHPCPVNLRVWEMDGPDRCLMCFNCMRACPLDNVALFGRRPLASLWENSHPRFSDTILLSALTGFILLTFSRFWPPFQELLVLPVRWTGSWLGAAYKPVFLLWLGMGLPLLIIVIPAAMAVWSRNSTSETGPAGEAGLTGSPVRVWLEPAREDGSADPDGEERVMDPHTVRGLSALYAPSAIPLLLAAHLVVALVKLNTKLAYVPVAAADPAGVRSYMAIWELGVLPRPEMLLPMGTVRITSLVLLITGAALSLLTYCRISDREGRGAIPMLFPPLFLAVVVFGGLFHWLF